MTALAQMQMVAFRLVNVHVEFDDECLGGPELADECADEDVHSQAEWHVVSADDRVYAVGLRLDFQPKQREARRFRQVALSVAGMFRFAPDIGEDTFLQLLASSAPAMLHGMARGILAQTTGLCVGGPFLLPALNYLTLFEQWRERVERELAAAGTPEHAKPRTRERKARATVVKPAAEAAKPVAKVVKPAARKPSVKEPADRKPAAKKKGAAKT